MIRFPPTYRFEIKKNYYTRNRLPAWTDRIHYKSKILNDLIQVNYDSALEVLGSDHRAVFS